MTFFQLENLNRLKVMEEETKRSGRFISNLRWFSKRILRNEQGTEGGLASVYKCTFSSTTGKEWREKITLWTISPANIKTPNKILANECKNIRKSTNVIHCTRFR